MLALVGIFVTKIRSTSSGTRSGTGGGIVAGTREDDILGVVVVEKKIVLTLIEVDNTTLGRKVVQVVVALFVVVYNTQTRGSSRTQRVIRNIIVGPLLLPIGATAVLLPVIAVIRNDIYVEAVCMISVVIAQVLMIARRGDNHNSKYY